jgi:excisionase family DNA binding protein
MSPAEAADYLDMREDRLRRLAQRGLIAKHKDGTFLRFTKADLDDYVRSVAVPRRNPYQTSARSRP